MSGSFHNYARKVRDPNLSLARRASALRSCIRKYAESACKPSYLAVVAHLSRLVGTNLFRTATEGQILEALQRLEAARAPLLELERAFGLKRRHQKRGGRRVPSDAERQALSEARENIKKTAVMLLP